MFGELRWTLLTIQTVVEQKLKLPSLPPGASLLKRVSKLIVIVQKSCGVFKRFNFFRKPHNTSRMLRDNPHKKGQVIRLRITTPRKPNSARRKTLKVRFTNGLKPVAYIPGKGHNLKRFATVILRGRGPRDTPGVYLSAVRGAWDFLHAVINKEGASNSVRTTRRSIYGGKKPITDESKQKGVRIKRRPSKKFAHV